MLSGSQNTQNHTLISENYSLLEILKWTFWFLFLWIEIMLNEFEFLTKLEQGKCRNIPILGYFKFC
jgi:hypothetical protein